MDRRQRLAWYNPRNVLRAILSLEDTPHQIAFGTAIGMFIAMTPTVGIQMLIVVILAFFFRGPLRFNKAAALITVYVSNPLTIIPIYWFNYKVGTLFMAETVSRGEFETLVKGQPSTTWTEWWAELFSRAWILLVEVGAPLAVGSLIVAPICAVVTYPLILRLLAQVRTAEGPPTPSADQPRTREGSTGEARSLASPSEH